MRAFTVQVFSQHPKHLPLLANCRHIANVTASHAGPFLTAPSLLCRRSGHPAAGGKSTLKSSGLVLRQKDPHDPDNYSSVAEDSEWYASTNDGSSPSGYTDGYQPYGEENGDQYAVQSYAHGEYVDQSR